MDMQAEVYDGFVSRGVCTVMYVQACVWRYSQRPEHGYVARGIWMDMQAEACV